MPCAEVASVPQAEATCAGCAAALGEAFSENGGRAAADLEEPHILQDCCSLWTESSSGTLTSAALRAPVAGVAVAGPIR